MAAYHGVAETTGEWIATNSSRLCARLGFRLMSCRSKLRNPHDSVVRLIKTIPAQIITAPYSCAVRGRWARLDSSSHWDEHLDTNSQNSFDAIRLALATLVILEHSYFLPFNTINHEPLFVFSRGQTDFGSVAVNFFFVLSGFLITRSWLLTKGTTRYLQKRISRIVPGFLVATTLTLVIAALSSVSLSAFLFNLNLRAIIAKIISLHQLGLEGFPNNPMKGMIDGTLWTIKYEFDCYLLTAGIGLCGLLNRATISVLVIITSLFYVMQGLGFLLVRPIDHGVAAVFISSPHQWPRLFTYFFAGSAFYLWRNIIPKSVCLALLGFISVVFALRYGGAEPILIIGGTYLLFFVGLSTAVVPRIGGKRADLSYGLYLFGFPIQQTIIAWSAQSISPSSLFALSFPATCLVAYISWVFIESPALRFKWPTLFRGTESHRFRV